MREAPATIRFPRDEQYLLDRSIPEPNTGCWLWLGALTPDGYASIMLLPFVRGHALACFLSHGEAPEGSEVDHVCRVRSCVNPKHVRYATHADNNRYALHVNLLKTHCLRGHPLTGENLRLTKKPTRAGFARVCKTCERDRRQSKRKRAC